MRKVMKKYKAGSVFSFKISNGMYLSGRIVLDVAKQCVNKKLIEPDSPLSIYNGALLVEVYKGITATPEFNPCDILIPGVFVDKDALNEGEWGFIDYENINPENIEFPESFIDSAEGIFFARGEVRLSISLERYELEKINIRPSMESSYALPDICLYYLDLKHLVDHEYAEQMNLASSDLRFSPHRSRIYSLLGENESESYYQMSTRYGNDISRFYK